MSLWLKIKEIVQKMLPKKSIEDVLHITPCMSDRMSDAIQLWSDMYEGHSPWLKEPTFTDPTRIVSLGLPSFIASEKARMVTLEMKSEVSAPMSKVSVDETMEPGLPPVESDESNVKSNLETDEKPAVGGNSIPTEIAPSSAFKTTQTEVPTGPTERADFLNKQYEKLQKQIRRQLEYGIAKGGLVIKPYIVIYDDSKLNTDTSNSADSDENASESTEATKTSNSTTNDEKSLTSNSSATTSESSNIPKSKIGKKSAVASKLSYNPDLEGAEIEFDFIQADRFFPLAFDANGKVIEAAFVQTKVDKAQERVFIRLEYHKLEKRTVTVQNMAFESTDMSLANSNNIKSASNLGRPISLKEVPEWASLQPKTVIEDIDRLLFAYFRMPEANTVDPYSPLGVSGFSRAVQLIKDADMQYSRFLWEFEGGELAIDVDRDALRFTENEVGEARSMMPEKQQRLFRKVDLNNEETYNVFAPNLRDTSLVHGLNTILMRIEDATGLSRGTLSDVTQQEAKTATELKILKQRSYATNADIQMALQDALEDVVYVMDVYCTLYSVTPDGEYEVSFEWDDSIIVDNESELSKRITLMQNGLASKLETRMWYFGETENQARAALQQIDEEARQAMEQNVQAEMMKSAALGQQGGNEDNKLKEESSDTANKKSKGSQADSLDNPNKSSDSDAIKSDN